MKLGLCLWHKSAITVYHLAPRQRPTCYTGCNLAVFMFHPFQKLMDYFSFHMLQSTIPVDLD
jgi:hypothetical protein